MYYKKVRLQQWAMMSFWLAMAVRINQQLISISTINNVRLQKWATMSFSSSTCRSGCNCLYKPWISNFIDSLFHFLYSASTLRLSVFLSSRCWGWAWKNSARLGGKLASVLGDQLWGVLAMIWFRISLGQVEEKLSTPLIKEILLKCITYTIRNLLFTIPSSFI